MLTRYISKNISIKNKSKIKYCLKHCIWKKSDYKSTIQKVNLIVYEAIKNKLMLM